LPPSGGRVDIKAILKHWKLIILLPWNVKIFWQHEEQRHLIAQSMLIGAWQRKDYFESAGKGRA